MKFAKVESTPPPRPKKRPKRPTFTIGFRVDSATLAQLEERASRTNISVHEYARQRLLDDLKEQNEVGLLSEAKATRQSVEGLRDDIAATLEILLLNTTPIEGEDIRSWIGENLRRAGKG